MLPIERRLMMKCTMGVFLSLTKNLSALAQASTGRVSQTRDQLNWTQFIEKVAKFSQDRSHDHLSSSTFVNDVATLGAKLDSADPSLAGACSFLAAKRAATHKPLLIAETNRQMTFEVLLLSLESGYTIPLHDHPARSGVSICVSGHAKVKNYDFVPSSGSALLKQRSQTSLYGQKASTLTEQEGNVHTISALQSTQLIDVFSPPAPQSGGFHWFTAEPDKQDQRLLKVTSFS